jgi:hypothetical protein
MRRLSSSAPKRVATHTTIRLAALAAVLLTLSVSGCSTPSEPAVSVQEAWRYRGTQRLPVVLQLEGTLLITERSGTLFEGSLDLFRTDGAGQVERVSGAVRGRQEGSRVDFEAVLDGAVVRHVGQLAADTIAGSWLDDVALGASLVSGAFVLRRTP